MPSAATPSCSPARPTHSTSATRTCSATAPKGGASMPASALLAAASLASLRVASLNLCTDELLLALAAPEQIVSVTHLAHKPQEATLWRQARRYRQNDGSLLS